MTMTDENVLSTSNPYLETWGHLPGVPWQGCAWTSLDDPGFISAHEVACETWKRDAARLSDAQIQTLAFNQWTDGGFAWDARAAARAVRPRRASSRTAGA